MLNKIITFDNGEKYIVYDSVVKDNVYYYMLVGISEDENTVLKEKIKFSTANSDSTENLIFSDVTDLNNQTTGGRGNLSFTSINLPRIAIRNGICLKEREKADTYGSLQRWSAD